MAKQEEEQQVKHYAFYRKYRAQDLNQLVGQDHIKKSLSSAIAGEKLSHAYLFCGPRGTGKTSTARILAKMANCESAAERPCNKCPSCTSITEGSNLDLIEIDAASNRGIEDIRALRENIKLAPNYGKKKVYIIDECQMLTGEAFNALLKTLEEPPSHVMFILATTEVGKIPQTILSRVQKFDFKPGTAEEVSMALANVVKAEGLDVDPEALLLLAKKAQGSFRDGLKFLDQLANLGQRIDSKLVEENLSGGSWDGALQLLEHISQRHSSQALELLNKELQKGTVAKEFNLLLLDILRMLLLIRHDLGKQLVQPDVGENYSKLESLAKNFELNQVIETIDCCQNSLEQSRYVTIASLPLEVAVISSCLGKVKEEQIIVKEIQQVVQVKPEEKTPQVENITLTQPEVDDRVVVEKEKVDEQIPASVDTDKIYQRWAYILETVRAYNYSLEALLRSSKIKSCSETMVVIEVPYSFHQRMLEAPKSRDLLESIFSDILQRSVHITTVLGKRVVRSEELANIELAQDDDIVRLASEIFNS